MPINEDKGHNQAVGSHGESLATAYFRQRGFTIVARNWRRGRIEIDLIASKGDTIHFIEVKTKLNSQIGRPEDQLTAAKLKQMKAGAEIFLSEHPEWKWIQFDALAIDMNSDGSTDYFLFSDMA